MELNGIERLCKRKWMGAFARGWDEAPLLAQIELSAFARVVG